MRGYGVVDGVGMPAVSPSQFAYGVAAEDDDGAVALNDGVRPRDGVPTVADGLRRDVAHRGAGRRYHQ